MRQVGRQRIQTTICPRIDVASQSWPEPPASQTAQHAPPGVVALVLRTPFGSKTQAHRNRADHITAIAHSKHPSRILSQ